jgi:hypothetical protein
MQKHKFGETCPVTLVESVPVPTEHEKYCVDVLRPRRNGRHYVTRRSNLMQKQKFILTCPILLFV